MFNFQSKIVLKTFCLKKCMQFQVIIIEDESLCFGKYVTTDDNNTRSISQEDCFILHYGPYCVKKFVDFLFKTFKDNDYSAFNVFECKSTDSKGNKK
jgi:hypothetical protein